MTPVLIAVVLAIFIVVSVSLILRARKMAVQSQSLPEDELAEFQRMHEEGRISEEEYKQLKRVVASQTLGSKPPARPIPPKDDASPDSA